LVGWVLNLKLRFPNLIKKPPYNLYLTKVGWVPKSHQNDKAKLDPKVGMGPPTLSLIKALIIITEF
jgi:hypothetical protein